MEKQDQINIIAPAIRAIIGNGGPMPTVAYSQTLCGKKTGCVEIAVADKDDSQTILKKLTDTISPEVSSVTCVCVPGLGSFAIQKTDNLSGKAAGKIAVVTGAAQGFGLEIAQDLIAQGAYIALADVNETGAKAQAQKFCTQYGSDRVIAVAIDVTSPDSVRNALGQVVRTWGGVDVFVSNAGVLKAESVKTQSEKDFDFVTAVNYKGYFVCVQAAVPIMAVAHKINPACTSDIIQINSKSGLTGSNRNGAYAGGKFGGIGLTQSFALELIEDGIKVNAVCPGNFFDGPLWSDPNNGLFMQYLRTGKVPGAKTIAEVKKFYEDKVPMKRGCRTADVMKAIYYLMEQQYETGQAVPVTGGQVMLH